MAYTPDFRTFPGAGGAASSAAALDAGLRTYMLRVYNWMASGLLLTGIVALACNSYLREAFYPLVQTPRGLIHQPGALAYIAMFAPLAFVMVLSFGVERLSATAAKAIFWAFAATMGASMMNIFQIYTGESIVRVFFITAYDTQRIKATYVQFAHADGPQEAGKRSVYDALSLYLNFINLFMLLLQFAGDRRSN